MELGIDMEALSQRLALDRDVQVVEIALCEIELCKFLVQEFPGLVADLVVDTSDVQIHFVPPYFKVLYNLIVRSRSSKVKKNSKKFILPLPLTHPQKCSTFVLQV